MTSIDRDSILQACERLLYRAAHLTDCARWDDLASLFAPDGKLSRPSDPQHPIMGRAAIIASLRSRPTRTTRHVLSNVMIDVHSPTSAHISSTVVLYTGPGPTEKLPVVGQKILIGHFEDDVAFIGQTWTFITRDGSMALEFEVRG